MLISQLATDGYKYELKLTILLRMIQFMNKSQCKEFIKGIKQMLNEDVHKNIFKLNVNPVRMGLQLYHTIFMVTTEFAYS